VLGDLFDSSFLSSLGLDPALVSSSNGTVIVVFSNETTAPAQFFAFEQADASDPNRGARNFTQEVPAGQTRNEVLECPLGIVGPGTLDATFNPDTVGATVFTTTAGTAGGGTTTNAVDVDYAGSVLFSGTDFHCGDVIKITLKQTTTGTTTGGGQQQTQFTLSVELLPGR
jgi:hypothetical protein